ncbi:MAG: hypothetical protein SCH98_05645 [Deferrisomatales bacterium]|nr:hypothetical protein [Deferrisomatales bacterium]
MTTCRSAVLAALCAFLACAVARGAVYDPALTWRTIHTPHFRVHYHDGLAEEAASLAQVAEEVHGPLAELLGWTPREPTHVTLVDLTDRANAYTTVLPYNQIVIYPVRPALFQSIGDYRDWLRTVFVHEYAHVLGLDPVRGYSAVTRRVFGRVGVPLTPLGAFFWFFAAPPNLFLPPWVHEGQATNLETDFTGRGRKGSTWYRMIYRSDVAAGTIPPLDRLGGDFPEWPSFSTRYVYGARLLQWVQERHGREALGALLGHHAGRFPYAIDAPPARLTGRTYRGLYREMVSDLEAELGPEIEDLRRQGLTPHRVLTASGFSAAGPLWEGNDALLFTRTDSYGPPTLRRLRLSGDGGTAGEEVLSKRPGSASRPTRLPGGRIAFPRVEIFRPAAGGRLYTDLYSCDPRGRGLERLTRGARLRDADWSDSADAFSAVEVRGPQQRLVLLARSPGGRLEDARPLLAERGVRYDHPRWSPDGRRIAFSRKTEEGWARLAVLEVATGEVLLLTPEGSQAGFPAWSPDGRELAFSWDRTGVFDLYAVEPASGRCRRLTRVLGGAFEPDWSPDGSRIAFTSYSHLGFDLAVLELADALGDETPLGTPETASPPEAAAAAHAEDRPYAAWPRVLPTFWLPDLLADHAGIAGGVWTTGHDPLLRHKYYGAGFWAGSSRRFYGQGIYVNDAGYPTLTLRAAKLPVLHTELFETPGRDIDYWEEARSVEAEVRLRLPRALRTWSFAASWAWEEVSRLSRVGKDLDGRQDLADLPFQGRSNPLAVSLLHDSAFPHSTRFTLGPEAGRRLEGTYRLRDHRVGSEVDRQELLGEWWEYLPLPFPERATLALRAKAGTGWGEVPLQSVFQLGGLAGEFPVRGYPYRIDRGERAAVGTAELRLPLRAVYRGIRDWPTFLGHIHGAAFLDGGRTWRGGDGERRRGAGAELRADTLLGYYFPTTLVVGYAHGFDRDGEDQVYVTFRGEY